MLNLSTCNMKQRLIYMKRVIPAEYRFLISLLFAGLSISAHAQWLEGQWTGMVWQDQAGSSFSYSVSLQQNGQVLSGTAVSANRSIEARFQISGYWDGSTLALQEVKQTAPASPKWCLKYATLYVSTTRDSVILEGEWRADGCKPGKMRLSKKKTVELSDLQVESPLTLTGPWKGRLSQSDRDYGFYFEIDLQSGSNGISSISSDGPGGNATHALDWQFAAADSTIEIREVEVSARSNPDWKWCIKTMRLRLRRERLSYILEGDWQGHIEGLTPETGACAPGKVTLEKPVLTQTIKTETQPRQDAYSAETGREVKIDHVVEVSSAHVKLRVWDNGTVDGDVATIFLNGKRILKTHRVSKRKVVIPVSLATDNNILILHAEDLGDIVPNTVAVSVDDGKREQVIILSSNLSQSGAILIRQFKME
jgi:hypothetical protein